MIKAISEEQGDTYEIGNHSWQDVCHDLLVLLCSANAHESEQMTEKQFILRPIGSVHKENGHTTLVLNKKVEPALLGLDAFSHVWVFSRVFV